MKTTRRLAAILAADVVGYSRLMGMDEEGTLARLQVLRQELVDPDIAVHNGRIVKNTGDGVLVEFASVVDAVRCAAEVQREVRDRNAGESSETAIQLRIGIHQGDIMFEDGDIFGDGVNIAARLETLSEPGGICVSRRVQEDAAGRLDLAFEDIGEQKLKNIARPIRVYRVREKSPMPGLSSALALPDKPAIAVLPFQNMSGDVDQEYFADGLTEDIITAISHNRLLFVIARNSTFIYKNTSVDIRQVGRDLGVHYVMEGSVRGAKDRIRVTAQLLEAASGRHIWAERYDRLVTDVFDVQDDITRSVAASTQTHIALDEGSRAGRVDRADLNVWLLVRRSWTRLHDLTPNAVAEARQLAEEAVELAPNSAFAHEVLAIVLVHQALMHMIEDEVDACMRAKESALKALGLEGHSEYAYWALGVIQFASGELDQAILSTRHALEINPNCALAYGTLGSYLALSGRAEEGIAATELALRINPRDPSNFFRYLAMADAYFVKRDFEETIEWASKAVVMQPGFSWAHLRVIAGLSLLGRSKEAQKAIQRYKTQVPEEIRTRDDSIGFIREEDRALFRDGLTRAGLSF